MAPLLDAAKRLVERERRTETQSALMREEQRIKQLDAAIEVAISRYVHDGGDVYDALRLLETWRSRFVSRNREVNPK